MLWSPALTMGTAWKEDEVGELNAKGWGRVGEAKTSRRVEGPKVYRIFHLEHFVSLSWLIRSFDYSHVATLWPPLVARKRAGFKIKMVAISDLYHLL